LPLRSEDSEGKREREKKRMTEREADVAERKRNKSGNRGWRLREIKVE